MMGAKSGGSVAAYQAAVRRREERAIIALAPTLYERARMVERLYSCSEHEGKSWPADGAAAVEALREILDACEAAR